MGKRLTDYMKGMDMNFSKEYIELCKGKEIQELRKELQKHDWYCQENTFNIPHTLPHGIMLDKEIRKDYFWLPTGDQLNNEIERICKGKKRTYYFISDYDDNYYAEVKQTYRVIYSKSDHNPYIAKIKLLKALLKE